MSENKSILLRESFSNAITIIELYKFLVYEKKEFVLSKQLLRSGTSVGANIREAQNAESTNDFIHKLAIAQKECDETIYWLELLKETDYIPEMVYQNVSMKVTGVYKMIRSAIFTLKAKKNKTTSNS